MFFATELDMRVMVVALAVSFTAGCFASERKPLSVRPPIQSAEVDTYGWASGSRDQEIWVTLSPGVLPSSVVDLSVFGPFVPGMTQDQATAIAGPPARTWKDQYDEVWAEYETPKAKVQIVCQQDRRTLGVACKA